MLSVHEQHNTPANLLDAISAKDEATTEDPHERIDRARLQAIEAIAGDSEMACALYMEHGLNMFHEIGSVSKQTQRELQALTRDGRGDRVMALMRGLTPRYWVMSRVCENSRTGHAPFMDWRQRVNDEALQYMPLIRREISRDRDSYSVQEEAQQALLEKAIESIDRFRPGKGNLRPYVHDSLKMLGMQERRKARESHGEIPQNQDVLHEQTDPGHESLIIAQKVIHSVVNEHMTPREKTIFELAFVQQMGTRDIARKLDLNDSCISGFKSRIKKKLARYLEFEED